MPLENVEIVRRWFELWTERDWDAFGAIHAPDVIVIPPEGWPDGEVSKGRDAWIRQSMRLKDSWESDRNELDEVRDAGNHVLARTRWITTGKDSGIDFETQFWAVFTLSDGKVARIEWFLERSRALEAAGLLKKDTRAVSAGKARPGTAPRPSPSPREGAASCLSPPSSSAFAA